MRLSLVFICVSATVAHAGELPKVIGMHPRTGPALAMVDSDVEVTVRGPIAEAVVTQKFVNRTDKATEATYVFPLPLDAAVTAMSIKYGTKTIRAQIAKREDAQRRYEEAVRNGVGGALLDQERPDVFTQTVTAIPPRATIEVTLRFDTLARFQDGVWELVLPMVVAPRYVPGRATNQPTTGTGRAPDTNRAPDASRVTPGGSPGAGGATQVVIRFADKPTDVSSPTHEIKLTGTDATFTDPKTDHDAIIRWKSTLSAAGWVEPAPDGGFAAVVVEAPVAQPRKGSMRCLLVVDRSAASLGDADAVARPLVRSLLATLSGADRVAVEGSDQLAWNTPADIARALEQAWPNPAGAFDLTKVLTNAKPQGAPIVLVSGGLVADDRAVVVAAARLGVPIHVIGVGPAPARGLLAQVAATTGGTLRFAFPGDDVKRIATAILADAATPATPLTVTWGTLSASDVVPGSLPRLGSGQATIVLARVKRAQTANARTRGDVFAIEVLPAAPVFEGATTTLGPLGRRWARNRLDELLYARATPAVVTAHALRYGLVSPHTSMVAIGTEVIVKGGVKHSIAIPVSVPAGMKWQAVKQQTTPDVGTTNTEVTKEAPKPGVRDPVVKKPADNDRHKGDPKKDATKPAPPPSKSPVPDGNVRQKKKHGRDDGDSRGADKNDESEDDAISRRYAEPSSVAVGGMAPVEHAEVLTASSDGGGRRRWRIAAAVGGGFLRFDGENRGLVALETRFEHAAPRRLLVGVAGSLWLVGGEDVAGQVQLTVARVGIAKWFELGFGAGLHFGVTGNGPAASLGLRFHLPSQRRASLFLRYDGALLYESLERRGQNTATFGIEYGF